MVRFREDRWDSLHISDGWAATQHQTLLRTNLSATGSSPSRLGITLVEGAEWALFGPDGTTDGWHLGDTYSYSSLHPTSLDLAHVVEVPEAGTYTFVVRSVYDLRIKGDPRGASKGVDDDGIPVSRFRLAVEDISERTVEVVDSFSLASDRLAKSCKSESASDEERCRLASPFVGIVVRNWLPETVTIVGIRSDTDGLTARLHAGEVTIAPGQMRPVAVILDTDVLIKGDTIDLTMAVKKVNHELQDIPVTVKIGKEHPGEPIKYTFVDGDGSVQYAMALPPLLLGSISPVFSVQDPMSISPPSRSDFLAPIVVVLHGAGVDVGTSPFLTTAVPAQNHSWVLFPTGRTPWGFDWHGPSLVNVESAVYGLKEVHKRWIVKDGKAAEPDAERWVVLGHSNGGQGEGTPLLNISSRAHAKSWPQAHGTWLLDILIV